MTLSNRDRMGKAVELLGSTLNRFLTVTIDSELPDGTTRVDLLRLKDDVRPCQAERAYNADDPSNSFRMITDNIACNYRRGWYPFDQHLSRLHQAYATEVKDICNLHAHMEALDNDAAPSRARNQ
ncbi:Swt1 family HEPN domain-containing protein [Williamsia sp. CHRR-6]|uniref:Swt1 family HEPN domain-containing protein n=1 Tax=Williamsia sp. CHRR-6 TaxID=2835871 RepID=UPI001BD94913|nr:Swt1 family HEPN domain-containing protein [Williamsia sp. CHRR-6]MBT0566705.1 hypothetical protein [Williamsia sp. CHRR-6]